MIQESGTRGEEGRRKRHREERGTEKSSGRRATINKFLKIPICQTHCDLLSAMEESDRQPGVHALRLQCCRRRRERMKQPLELKGRACLLANYREGCLAR